MSATSIKIWDLGRISYQGALSRQLLALEGRISGQCPDTVLLCEHVPAVYTGGKRCPEFEGSSQADRLRGLGAECYSTCRGGQLTWHGPGQLTVYPIMRIGLGMRAYVGRLEEVLLGVGAGFGMACRRMAEVGVCTADGRKFGFVGVAQRHGVSFHGLGINVRPDLSWFSHIVPCGMPGLAITSIEKETGRPVDLSEVKEMVVEEFRRVFAADVHRYLE